MTKIWSVLLFERWEFNGYVLVDSKEKAIEISEKYNNNLSDICKKGKCCFARYELKEVNDEDFFRSINE